MEEYPSILVIDDEPDNFDVIDTLLDNTGYQLNYASNGEKALELLESFLPDLILLDVMMPNMSGIEFCQIFKGNPLWQHIPVIMVTALTNKEDLSQCLTAGADDFISKPVNSLELRARVRSMLRIKQQYDALQDTLRLREDLSRMVVHDLRNPLSSIVLAAEMIQLPNFSPERLQHKVNQILIATQQLESLIDTLLLMAKIESGKMLLNLVEIDLCGLCTRVVKDLSAIAGQKKLELVLNLPESGHYINVDVALFRRILENLLSNAMKFSPSGSKILLTVNYPAPKRVKIQVIDSGPGVDANLRQSIFQRYEIGTLMKDTSQIGLGLAFCKMAVEAHGGQIHVEENYPQGAIFTIDLITDLSES
ncbi:hybrid sensor histidine kinase/response regulator [Phormidium sp. LEGE 05292]|uniref:hybrid sensor histidine kinase/response regulator n=1 Tax=[Phormidium] sp. LEGE 05292 TaxID=767427 RepID=UPI00187EECA4|nr:hybrid sensor histidine kinase/response regulator [Phormidium sp. LEGE 05292]MBE9229790.1 hybrid sensor histidine kinase/response regulator [Phormidium sp. LEGE 05292]